VSGEYLIQLRVRVPWNLPELVENAGGQLEAVYPDIRIARATSDDPDFAANLEGTHPFIKKIHADQSIEWVPSSDEFGEPIEIQTAGGGGDPTDAALFACQWNLLQIDAPGAWSLGAFGAPSVKVAVLDTGIDPAHVDLAGKVDLEQSKNVVSHSFCDGIFQVPDSASLLDFNTHGTFVASLITSNGIGIAGVAPASEIVAIKVLGCLGSGSFGDVIAGLYYAASLEDVEVVNLSLNAYLPRGLQGVGPLLALLSRAVNHVKSRGKLVVAAAGNQGANLDTDKNWVSVPAQTGSAIGAYATAIDESVPSYSNRGRTGTWVGAPGGDSGAPAAPIEGCPVPTFVQGRVWGACSSHAVGLPCNVNSYLGSYGTSFASPLLAGVAALIDARVDGAYRAGKLRSRLGRTADDLGDPGKDGIYSRGRLNAWRAVGGR
jgi:subtilisin family serine protease